MAFQEFVANEMGLTAEKPIERRDWSTLRHLRLLCISAVILSKTRLGAPLARDDESPRPPVCYNPSNYFRCEGRMPVNKEYLDYVLDQLSCIGPIAHKRMFGGVGLYFDGLFFALIDDDVVYFKVDDETRPRYQAARTKPFQPGGEGPSQGYYSVPVDVLEDLDELKAWGTQAVEVARRKASGKKPRSKKRS